LSDKDADILRKLFTVGVKNHNAARFLTVPALVFLRMTARYGRFVDAAFRALALRARPLAPSLFSQARQGWRICSLVIHQ